MGFEGPIRGGGLIEEGWAIATLIRTNNLSTIVRGDCESACTLAFVAADDRTITATGRLGFHVARFVGWHAADEIERWISYFESRGVESQFIRRGLAVPATEMWYPTVEELQAAGVVLTVVDTVKPSATYPIACNRHRPATPASKLPQTVRTAIEVTFRQSVDCRSVRPNV